METPMNHTPGHFDCPACEAARHSCKDAALPYLEEHPGSTGYDVGHAGERVPLAAQVFSNYIFIAPHGHPDSDAGPSGLHGAAVLVFADQPEKQIHLRTGYATHVARHPVLVAREDVSNEVVSGHNNSSQKEGKTMAIACSVCHAAIMPGATVCPGCGLQLVAQAVPVIRRRSSVWSFILFLAAVFVAVGWLNSMAGKNASEKRQSDLQAALAKGSLNTPEAFQARCGQARWTEQTKDGTELHYRIGAADTYVTFAAGGLHFQSEQTDWSGTKPVVYRITVDPAEIIRDLGCK
jgi:hypothetical protein